MNDGVHILGEHTPIHILVFSTVVWLIAYMIIFIMYLTLHNYFIYFLFACNFVNVLYWIYNPILLTMFGKENPSFTNIFLLISTNWKKNSGIWLKRYPENFLNQLLIKMQANIFLHVFGWHQSSIILIT